MSRLPEANLWDPVAVKGRMRFLRLMATRVPALLFEFSAPLEILRVQRGFPAIIHTDFVAPNFDGAINEGDELLMRVAELAFATNSTNVGIEALREISSVTRITEAQPTRIPDFAIPAAIVGNAKFAIVDGAFSVTTDGTSVAHPWNELGSATQIARAIPKLTLAALLSSADAETSAIMFDQAFEDRLLELSFRAALLDHEMSVLPLFGFQFGRQEMRQDYILRGMFALLEMERIYSAHITLLAADSYHWKELRPRGALIDWSLLAIHIALRQRSVVEFSLPTPLTQSVDFIRSLAAEITQLE